MGLFLNKLKILKSLKIIQQKLKNEYKKLKRNKIVKKIKKRKSIFNQILFFFKVSSN